MHPSPDIKKEEIDVYLVVHRKYGISIILVSSLIQINSLGGILQINEFTNILTTALNGTPENQFLNQICFILADTSSIRTPELKDHSDGHTIEGQILTLNCSLGETNIPYNFSWDYPKGIEVNHY